MVKRNLAKGNLRRNENNQRGSARRGGSIRRNDRGGRPSRGGRAPQRRPVGKNMRGGRTFRKPDGRRKPTDKNVKDQKKSMKKQEEEIDEINYEKELFDDEGYYKGDANEDVHEDDWMNEASINNKSINLGDELIKKMNNVEESQLDPRVIQAYKMVGDVLKTYTSGKLPKAFNVLPTTESWEELIDLTRPEEWTPHAMYEATIMFSSNLNAFLAERFYQKVLLPKIRSDIKRHKKLNVHYYKCLKKAIFKPSGFFKGIIIPISKNASAKEAAILGSILKKCSIPVAHSSACIMNLLAENSLHLGALYFLKILLLKKYALPTSVKEALVKYFCSFRTFSQVLPVSWHQTLLIFVQIYKFDLSEDEKNSLEKLITVQNHHMITEDIFRELNYKKPNFTLKNNEKMILD